MVINFWQREKLAFRGEATKKSVRRWETELEAKRLSIEGEVLLQIQAVISASSLTQPLVDPYGYTWIISILKHALMFQLELCYHCTHCAQITSFHSEDIKEAFSLHQSLVQFLACSKISVTNF